MLLLHAALVCALLPGAGQAKVNTLRVFSLSGDAPTDVRLETERAVQAGIIDPTLEVTLEGTPIADATVVFGCSANEPACIQSIAKALRADLLLHGSVQKKGARHLELLLTLARADGRVLATTETKFERAALRERVERAVRDLVARGLGRPAPRGKVTINSEPPGASVFQSGELMGKTPIELEVTIGAHLFEFKLGDQVERREATIVAGKQTLDVEFPPVLAAGAGASTAVEPKGQGSWIGPSVGIGLGAVAIGVGVALMASARSRQTELDEGVAMLPSPPTASEQGRLAELDEIAKTGRTNATVGYVAVGVGVATAVIGLIWGLSGSSDDDAATIEPTASGAVVRW